MENKETLVLEGKQMENTLAMRKGFTDKALLGHGITFLKNMVSLSKEIPGVVEDINSIKDKISNLKDLEFDSLDNLEESEKLKIEINDLIAKTKKIDKSFNEAKLKVSRELESMYKTVVTEVKMLTHELNNSVKKYETDKNNAEIERRQKIEAENNRKNELITAKEKFYINVNENLSNFFLSLVDKFKSELRFAKTEFDFDNVKDPNFNNEEEIKRIISISIPSPLRYNSTESVFDEVKDFDSSELIGNYESMIPSIKDEEKTSLSQRIETAAKKAKADDEERKRIEEEEKKRIEQQKEADALEAKKQKEELEKKKAQIKQESEDNQLVLDMESQLTQQSVDVEVKNFKFEAKITEGKPKEQKKIILTLLEDWFESDEYDLKKFEFLERYAGKLATKSQRPEPIIKGLSYEKTVINRARQKS